ncbi:3-hydroxyacyl-CoA dehydrogenase [Halopolyspora algeriensis]|uniref:3-hydroxyacyl-CoA dehydrogenase n=1 Tax=Halopolyspora algeriensis TaxID=1500506 RepID=A0A368VQQ9_9ACTN|nr:3-hydroxyacyl-CoA dehydrogenase [Halopolyspora algeriensis]TQM53549.1 3-hydroxyacyl-CoA dehydrogenase [Halopolyspora algeriensis]
MVTEIQRVGVIGAGQMGSGIAEVSARAGLDVVLTDVSDEAAEAGRSRIRKSLDRAVQNQKIGEADRDAAQERIRTTTSLNELHDRELVIEAIAENEEVKTKVFAELDQVIDDPEAILASNTSSIPIAKLAAATKRPDRVIGIHFFNPVPVLKLVELIPSLLTSEQTTQRAADFATGRLGKETVRAQDRAGFVVNALLVPYLLSAIRMVEGGFATAEDVDNGMVLGCAHPMGPLRLSDMVGLDTIKAVADSMYAEYKDPSYAAPPLLQRMVDAKLLGKKSGKGFYEYG